MTEQRGKRGPYKIVDPRVRFEAKFEPEPNSGCYLWLGPINNNGYGMFGYGRVFDHTYSMKSSHRVAWELYIGPIPEGLQVLHKCDVRICVNPTHLFLGTSQDNHDDMWYKNRQPAGRQRRKSLNIVGGSTNGSH
jgi:hypothetical protein